MKKRHLLELEREHSRHNEHQAKRLRVRDELGLFKVRREDSGEEWGLSQGQIRTIETWVQISPSTHTRYYFSFYTDVT